MAGSAAHYRTVLTIVSALLLLYYFTGWENVLAATIVLGLLSVFVSRIAQGVHAAWMLLAKILGYIIPNILLSLIFYLVLFPVALMARVFRKEKPVILENRPKSMFREREETFEKKHFEHPW